MGNLLITQQPKPGPIPSGHARTPTDNHDATATELQEKDDPGSGLL